MKQEVKMSLNKEQIEARDTKEGNLLIILRIVYLILSNFILTNESLHSSQQKRRAGFSLNCEDTQIPELISFLQFLHFYIFIYLFYFNYKNLAITLHPVPPPAIADNNMI